MTETQMYRVYTRTEDGSTGHTVVEAEDRDEARRKALGEEGSVTGGEDFTEVSGIEEYEEGQMDHPDLTPEAYEDSLGLGS